jgi:hypothetical protein
LEIYRRERDKKERVKKDVKLTTAEIKNGWSHTSTPPVCLHGSDENNFALLPLKVRGHAAAQWLRHCATNRKVAGSIPDGVTGFFH